MCECVNAMDIYGCKQITMVHASTDLTQANDNNNGPNGHLFYVGGDLMMRRGMLPIIKLPDGDLRIVLHLVPF